MNFLAHLYLSGDNKKVMVGNFIGDFVKGKQFEVYETDIRRGILLHRQIDAYTDRHPGVLESKEKLRKKYRHYAGVIIDMFYDHFLAANWTAYHPLSLEVYTQNAYTTIFEYESILPQGVKYMLPFMMENNWLLHYAQKEGIRRALTGMARRTKFKSGMEEAVDDLEQYYDEFRDEFTAFFPDVSAYAADWLEKH